MTGLPNRILYRFICLDGPAELGLIYGLLCRLQSSVQCIFIVTADEIFRFVFEFESLVGGNKNINSSVLALGSVEFKFGFRLQQGILRVVVARNAHDIYFCTVDVNSLAENKKLDVAAAWQFKIKYV